MNVASSDLILLAHATFGVLGTLAALWVLVEALNAKEENAWRTRKVALVVAGSMGMACIFGGYFYLHFYSAEKAIILEGPWPFAHTLFMETKEHFFLAVLILAFYLPIAAWDRLYASVSARKMVLCVALLIVLGGLAIEGSGAVINLGVKVALLRGSAGVPR